MHVKKNISIKNIVNANATKFVEHTILTTEIEFVQKEIQLAFVMTSPF